MNGTGRRVGVEHRQRVAHVGVPAVQHGVLGVAVAPLVPAHDPPAAVGQQRGEHVERAGEVETPVGEQDRGASSSPHSETDSRNP